MSHKFYKLSSRDRRVERSDEVSRMNEKEEKRAARYLFGPEASCRRSVMFWWSRGHEQVTLQICGKSFYFKVKIGAVRGL